MPCKHVIAGSCCQKASVFRLQSAEAFERLCFFKSRQGADNRRPQEARRWPLAILSPSLSACSCSRGRLGRRLGRHLGPLEGAIPRLRQGPASPQSDCPIETRNRSINSLRRAPLGPPLRRMVFHCTPPRSRSEALRAMPAFGPRRNSKHRTRCRPRICCSRREFGSWTQQPSST